MQKDSKRGPTSVIMSQGLSNNKKRRKVWKEVLRHISFLVEDCLSMDRFWEPFWIKKCFKLVATKENDAEQVEKLTPKLIQVNEQMNPTRMQSQCSFWTIHKSAKINAKLKPLKMLYLFFSQKNRKMTQTVSKQGQHTKTLSTNLCNNRCDNYPNFNTNDKIS